MFCSAGGEPDQGQTLGALPNPPGDLQWVFIFHSNLLLFPLQAAELGMVSAYYTYIFTNLVRHFHSSPLWHREYH